MVNPYRSIYRSRIGYLATMAMVVGLQLLFVSGDLERDGLGAAASFAIYVWMDFWLAASVVLTLKNWEGYLRYLNKPRRRLQSKQLIRRLLVVVLCTLLLAAFIAAGLLERHWLNSNDLKTQTAGILLFGARAAVVAAVGLWFIAQIQRLGREEAG